MLAYLFSMLSGMYVIYYLCFSWNKPSLFDSVFSIIGLNVIIVPFIPLLKFHAIPGILLLDYLLTLCHFDTGLFGLINASVFHSFVYYSIFSGYVLYFSTKFIQRTQSVVSRKSEQKPKLHKTISIKKVVSNSFTLPSTSFLQNAKLKKSVSIPKAKLAQVLKEFNVEGELLQERNGPVITLFEFAPAPGVKASKIVNLAADIARATESLSARISTIPGKNLLGIELPNQERQTIQLRELIESSIFQYTKCQIPLAIGLDITGNAVVVDLSTMPHLLISGTTGSGKSVSMHSMILSVLFSKDPDDCKLILVDPKMLELSVYNDIPHLLSPVVTDPKEAIKVLKWAVQEMDRRYRLISELEVRNILSFNERISDKKFDIHHKVYEKLPYIVIIVDEMADLMITAGKEVEILVQRLAQKARAAGIHIIMATQRPSVDVITGTIKSNFPARITFQLASKIDSRTVMDSNSGAEQLLGRGDMLYLSPGYPVSRIQAPFVSDEEINAVTEFLKKQKAPNYIKLEVKEIEEIDENEDVDPMYSQALELIRRTKKTSASFIQRELRIGYNRASRIVEAMEKQGVLSKPDHTNKRDFIEF
ncbi:MAG: hypothetical protein H6845_01580 [Alphaproteobacteria bacterium]|nr:MAG: hypothetical protein H6845_01580 [Alphaproteobacteria bacterium]